MRISKKSLSLSIWIIFLLIVGCSSSGGSATVTPTLVDTDAVNDSKANIASKTESTKIVSSTLVNPPSEPEENSANTEMDKSKELEDSNVDKVPSSDSTELILPTQLSRPIVAEENLTEPLPGDLRQIDLDQEFISASKQFIEIENRRMELIDALILSHYADFGIPDGGFRQGSTGDKRLAFEDGLGNDNLSSLLFEIAVINVPDDLESLKAELLEIYRLEIMATYLSGDCISSDCDSSIVGDGHRYSSRLEVNELNVVPKIQESNRYSPTYQQVLRIDSPWVTAQLHRAFVYERWLKQLNDIGVDVSESPWNSISLSENCRNGEKQFC